MSSMVSSTTAGIANFGLASMVSSGSLAPGLSIRPWLYQEEASFPN